MKIRLTLLLLLCTFYCRVQPSLASARPETPSVDTRLAALEAKNSSWEKFLSHLPKISGYIQTGYEWSESSSTFHLKRVRLSLAGDISPKFDYRIQLELCAPKLLDACIQYKPFTQLNFKLGQYKLPFSIDNTDYSPLKLECIEYPLVIRKLVAFNDVCGVSASGRDMGLTAYGGFFRRDGYCILNYDLGVFNGEGINTRDRNKSKDIVARLTLKPIAGLILSGSYYRGEYGEDYRIRTRYGAGIGYDRGPITVRGEWIGGRTGRSDGGDFDSDGWYVLLGWRATRTLMPVVRYDTFTTDCARRSATHQTNYTAGIAWQPLKYLRCQLNYTYEDYAAGASNNVLSLMFTGMF